MKIFLSPSNQVANSYAYGNTNESEVCGTIANLCKEALIRNGFDVMLMHSETMSTKCSKADSWGADLYIPIHTNAFDQKVSGTRMMYFTGSSKGKKACESIFKFLAPLTPGKSENITSNSGLYELKTPKAPTAYIEVDFHDVKSVAKWIIEHTNEIAEAIAKGVCDYAGVTYKAPSTESGKIYRVQVGAFSVKSNADSMLEKLKKDGYDGFIVQVEKD